MVELYGSRAWRIEGELERRSANLEAAAQAEAQVEEHRASAAAEQARLQGKLDRVRAELEDSNRVISQLVEQLMKEKGKRKVERAKVTKLDADADSRKDRLAARDQGYATPAKTFAEGGEAGGEIEGEGGSPRGNNEVLATDVRRWGRQGVQVNRSRSLLVVLFCLCPSVN